MGNGRICYTGVDPTYFGAGKDYIDPNFPMGTGGIGFLMLKLYEVSGKKEFLDAFLARNPDPKYVGKPIAIDVYMHRDWDSYIEYGLNTTDPRKEMY